ATLGRARRGEHLGWAGPALALGAAVVFVVLGERARSAVPPTAAYAQIVDAAAGVDEVQVSGQLAVYRDEAGQAPARAEQGGDFVLDPQGLEGRVLRRVQTDWGRWHWENLEVPAGVRSGRFRTSTRTTEPVVARARFGRDGLEGRVTTGLFGRLEDALISTPGPRKLAVRVAADGTFRAGLIDLLPHGKYVANTLLDDRQRERQALYAKAFAEPPPRSLVDRRLLLAWSAPLDPHFTFGPQTRLAGAALGAIPPAVERAAPDTPPHRPARWWTGGCCSPGPRHSTRTLPSGRRPGWQARHWWRSRSSSSGQPRTRPSPSRHHSWSAGASTTWATAGGRRRKWRSRWTC